MYLFTTIEHDISYTTEYLAVNLEKEEESGKSEQGVKI